MTDLEGTPPIRPEEGAPSAPPRAADPAPTPSPAADASATPPRPPRGPNGRLQIFISYRREDSSGQAGRLYDSLSEHFGAENVFMDLDTIGPGEDFVEVIDDALRTCDCVLVVIGPRWLLAEREGQRRLDDPADYLRIEVEHSLARAPRVIPVLVQDADMPASRELPEAIRGLARRNAFELSDSRWRLDVGRLIDALEGIERTLGLRGTKAAAEVPAMQPGATAPGLPVPTGQTPTRESSGDGPVAGYPPAATGPAFYPPTAGGLGGAYPPALPDPYRGAAPPPRPTAPARPLQPWVTQRIVPISIVLVLVVVAALGAYVLAKGSPAPTLPSPTTIAVASGTPTTAPTIAPATPTATASPGRSEPAPTPTAASTSAQPSTAPPSAGLTPLPSPVTALPPGIGLGANNLELNETFTSPGSFPTSKVDGGSFAYAGGGFDITVTTVDYSLWSPHVLAKNHPVLRVRGAVTVGEGNGNGALMCGNGSGDYLYGSVGADHGWAIGSIVSNTIQVIDNGTLPVDAQVPSGSVQDVRIECAVTGAATDRIQLIVQGTKVADSTAAPRVGPFDRGAMLGSSAQITPASIHFDNVKIWSGASFIEATESLRAHVPTEFANHCHAIQEDGSIGEVAALICNPAGTIDQAEYYRFDTQLAMTDDFAAALKSDGSSATGTDCNAGPSTSRYTDVNGKDAGSLACYPNPGSMGGLLITWTNESLDILSGGISTSGSYDDLATWWQTAGPLP